MCMNCSCLTRVSQIIYIYFLRNGQCNEFYLKTNKDPWILSAVKTARSTTLISLLSAIPTVCIIKSRPG